MRIIGVIGLNGSGKDEVVKYLNQRYGVPQISVGDIVREMAAQKGIAPTRDNLDNIVAGYFSRFGEDYIIKLVIDRIRQNQWNAVAISGIRSLTDVAVLKESFKNDFVLIHVSVTGPLDRYTRSIGATARGTG